MPVAKKTLRTCKQGHRYYKSSDCPVCPICEAERKTTAGFLSLLSAPARRAVASKGIKTLEQLASCSEAEILQLHGIGKSSLPKLQSALSVAGLSFRQ